MENRGLLFIPDISGFTQFVTGTEISHSRLIIQELLEVLINANQMGLTVSEIEGDAILFYKFGEAPALDELYRQVENMFLAFQRSLIAYEYRRFCQCKACRSAINLSLKIITHFGEFTGYQVQEFNKLIGKDVIVAHQLLKNDIELHEYWLVTQSLLSTEPPEIFTPWMKWDSSSREIESGAVQFHYTQLGVLKKDIPPDPAPQLSLSGKTKLLTVFKEYTTPILSLLHATGDFNYRSRWQEGVKAVEEVNHLLPRVGMRCRCKMENGQEIIYVSSYVYQPEKIEFSETEEDAGNILYYTIEKTGPDTASLKIDYYIPRSIIRQFLFGFQKKNKEKQFRRSLENLDALLKEMPSPDEP